jgi:hypothetical protein
VRDVARRARVKEWWNGSHSYFRVLLLAFIPAVAAAASAGGDLPAVALGSDVLYRAEIVVAVLLLAYAVLMMLWLAYTGRLVKVPVPGTGGGLEPTEKIDDAATSLETFKGEAQERFENHDDILRNLRDRLTAVEESLPGSPGEVRG